MHYLDRAGFPAPACLAAYRHPGDSWQDFRDGRRGGSCYDPVRDELAAMQQERCAYCEGPPHSSGHVDHFRRRRDFPDLTFEWSNLFLACGSDRHCGHFKDRPGAEAYDPSRLVKPDEVDPGGLLYFHSQGDVRPRSGLSDAERVVATETIRVFNLNHGELRAARRRAVGLYKRREPDILAALEEFATPERRKLINDEVKATADQPYATAIRHFFEKAY